MDTYSIIVGTLVSGLVSFSLAGANLARESVKNLTTRPDVKPNVVWVGTPVPVATEPATSPSPKPIIEVTPKPVVGFVFNDTFRKDSLDKGSWTEYCRGGAVGVESGRVSFYAPDLPAFPNPDLVCQIKYNKLIEGDFDTWVSFSDFGYKEGEPSNVTVKLYFSDRIDTTGYYNQDNFAYVLRQNYPGHGYQADTNSEEPTGSYSALPTDTKSGKLRIQRTRDMLNFFYFDGTAWKRIASKPKRVFPGYISIGLRTESDHPEAKVFMDDFHIEIKPSIQVTN